MSVSLTPYCGTRTQNCSGEWGAQSPLLQLTPPQPCAQTRRAPGPRALCAPGWGGWGTRCAPPKGLGVAEEGFAPPGGALLAAERRFAGPCCQPRALRPAPAAAWRGGPLPTRGTETLPSSCRAAARRGGLPLPRLLFSRRFWEFKNKPLGAVGEGTLHPSLLRASVSP